MQEAKPKRTKSRLSKNTRLAATENKEALSDILGIPRPEAIHNGKGALAQKLPVPANQIIAAQQAKPIVANQAIVATPAPIRSPPVAQRVSHSPCFVVSDTLFDQTDGPL